MQLRLNQIVEIRSETANGIPSVVIVGRITQMNDDRSQALFKPIHVGGMQDDLPSEYWVDATQCRVHIPKPKKLR